MAASNSVLTLWSRLASLPAGKWLFSRLICLKAPYFSSVRPRFVALRPGYCEVTIRKRRAVTNHLGTVHAIAMCNMAELAAGIMSEATVPLTHRWIPKGMSVEYLKKAGTDLRAVAELPAMPAFGAAAELPVPVSVTDSQGDEVCRAVIRMWVSPRKATPALPG
ncbi:MAG: hotdog fold domain-containing protein [Gammaproteobacteria bacterium]